VTLARKRKPKGKKTSTKENVVEEAIEQKEETGEERIGSGMETEKTSHIPAEGKKISQKVSSKSKRQAPVTSVGKTLVISGFGEDVTKKQIYKRCRKLGDIEETLFPVPGGDVPTAEVTYKTYKEARTAVSKLNDHTFKGCVLKAVVKSHQGKSPSSRALKKSRLIVRNLAFQATEDELRETFSPYGTVCEVNIPTNAQGRKKGFAFIQFTNVINAAKAVETLNGSKIKGRAVAVDWVVPKTLYENSKLSQGSDLQEGKVVDTDRSTDDGIIDRHGDGDNDDDSVADGDNEDDGGDDGGRSGRDGNVSDEEAESVDDDESDSEGSHPSDSDEEEEVDSESEQSSQEIEDKPVQKDKKKKTQSNDVEEGKTVFVRNVPFDCEEEDIEELFAQFGEIVYCKQVINPDTGVPKGTAFVKFSTPEEAQSCMQAASSDGQDPSTKGLVMDGRKLDVIMAVSRQQAASLKKTHTSGQYKEDRRNLYLAKEGQILPGSDLAKELSKSDMAKRMKSLQEKKTKLSNPNFFVSKTRLSVRNMPPTLDEKQLKRIFMQGAFGTRPRLKQVKILRSTDKMDTAGLGQSKGCGFVEFMSHESALAALRAVNNNPDTLPSHRRLIVEFSIENVKALKLQEDRKRRQVKYAAELSKNRSTDTIGDDDGGPGATQYEPMRKRPRSDQHSNKWRKRGAGGTDRHPKSPPLKSTRMSANSNRKAGNKPKKVSSSFQKNSEGNAKKTSRRIPPSKKMSTSISSSKKGHTEDWKGKDSSQRKKTPIFQKTNSGKSKNFGSVGPSVKKRSRNRRKENVERRERNFDHLVNARTKSFRN
jgi:nucleolar protein 4